jgi:hypothetical protein
LVQKFMHASGLAGGHATHAPAVQVCAAVQACPHEPQFAESLCKFAHVAPHAVNGAVHMQVLDTQLCPGAHA